jgi:hypothetical protein
MSTHVSKVCAASIIRAMALIMEAEDSELQQLIRTIHSKTKFIKSKYS